MSVNWKILFSKEWFIVSLQVIYFALYERFVKNKIHQFVDLCSISNVSSKDFYIHNMCLYVSDMVRLPFLIRFQCCCSPTLALAIISMGIRYTDTQIQTWRKWTTIWKEKPCVFQQRLHLCGCSTASWHCMRIMFSNVFSCVKESMCGQRGLLPNTEVQTFQVSFTRYLRLQYERIRDLSNRVCTVCCVRRY